MLSKWWAADITLDACLTSALGCPVQPGVAWLCAVLCPSCPLPHLSCPPCLPACQLPLFEIRPLLSQALCKTAMQGEIYGVRVSREWKSFLGVIACPWDQGGISDLLMLQSLSLCNVPKRFWSCRAERQINGQTPALLAGDCTDCLASPRDSVVFDAFFGISRSLDRYCQSPACT